MTRHVRIPLPDRGGARPERGAGLGCHACVQGREEAGRQTGLRPPLAHDARGQGRPDDPGRARAVRQDRRAQPERQRRPHHHLAARLDPVRWRLHPGGEHAEGVGRHGRPLPEAGARDPAGHPADLRHRLRPRRREHARGDRLPAQHRPRRHARPAPRARRRAHHRVGDALDRAAVELRAVHLRRARRPLGPHVRVLRRGPAARREVGDRDRRPPGVARPAQGPRPRARDSEALRGRRRHAVRHRQR